MDMELFMKEKDMPKYCYVCPCHEAEHGICNLNGEDICLKNSNDCPIKSIEEHDKEIRAEFEKEMEIKKRRFDLIYQENQMLIKELTNLKFNNKGE